MTTHNPPYIRVAANVVDTYSTIEDVYAIGFVTEPTGLEQIKTIITNLVAMNVPDHPAKRMFNPLNGMDRTTTFGEGLHVIAYLTKVYESVDTPTLTDVVAGNSYHVYIYTKNGSGYEHVVKSESHVGLLDTYRDTTYSETNGAYSVRKLYQAYQGPQLRVRRSVDNVEQDFTFDDAGINANYEAWIGESTAYVVTWYDQSGNERNATASAADAVTFDYTNKRLLFNTEGYFHLPDATVPFNNDPYTFIVYHGRTDNNIGVLIGSGSMATNQSNTLRRSTNNYSNYWFWNDIINGTYNHNQVVVARYDGSTRNLYAPDVNGNGSEQPVSTARQSTSVKNSIGWFYQLNNEYWRGDMYTVLIYKSALDYNDISGISSLLTS